MPIFNVRAPDGSLMKISGPEDATDEELIQIAEQNYKEKPKFKDYLKDIPKAVGRGGAGLLETSAIGAAALLPEEYEQSARKGIAGIAKPVQEYLAPSSQEVGESTASKVASGLGSILPMAPLGFLGVPGALAGVGVGFASGAGEARLDAEKAGATAEQKSKATGLGVIPGGFDAAVDMALAAFPGGAGKAIGVIRRALISGGIEGATEAAQQVAQNAIAKNVYKPEQELLAGASEQGEIGAAVGALASFILDAAIPGRRRGAVKDTGAPQPERELTQAPERAPVETFTQPPVGFDAERAAGLRAQAEQAEQDRLAGIEAGRLAEEAAAQQAVRGMPAFAGTPDINAELVAASRADRAEEQKRLEAERRAQIKQIENTQFSTDPFQDQIMRNRALQQIAPATEVETTAAPEPKAVDPLAELTQEIPDLPTYKPKAPPKTVPMSAEDVEAVKAYKQDLAAVEKQLTEAKKGGTDLFKRLDGAMSYQDVLEVAPEVGNKLKSRDADTAKKVDKYKKLVDKTGKGRSLSSMVADGSLNEYLPPNMRIGEPGVDEAEAVQYIYDKLASGDTRSFDESQAMRALEEQRATLQELINDPQRRADLNYQAQAAAAEQRGVEPLPLGDLITDAQARGVDVDAVMERVSMQMPEGATEAQYLGALHNALTSATNNYEIDGVQYSQEEVETLIEERFTPNEIDDLIDQTQAEQTTAAQPAEVSRPATTSVPVAGRKTKAAEPAVAKTQKPNQPPLLKAPEGFKLKKGRNEQVVLAARELDAGRITKQQYDQYVDYYMPIEKVWQPEPPLTKEGMGKVLKSNQTQKIDAPIPAGTEVGLRMDINALESGRKKGINGSVVAIHPKNNPKTAIGYAGAAHLTGGVNFVIRSEKSAMRVATSEADKAPQQTLEGKWVPTKPEEIYANVNRLLNDPQWVQVSLDPLRHSFFYDRANRQPVTSADEIFQVGRFVLAKNPVYAERESFLYSADKGEESQPAATKEEMKIESDLQGKNFIEFAKYVADTAPNKFYKYVANKVLNKLNAMQAAGVKFEFHLLGGDARPRFMRGNRGVTEFIFGKDGEPTKVTIAINGAPVVVNQFGYPSGMNYRTMLHELLHATTKSETYFLKYTDAYTKAVQDLNLLYGKVAEEFKRQRKEGTLPEFLQDFIKEKNNALASPDELLTWGMTDERMQDWLSNIKVGEKTAFTKLVEFIREVLGITKNFETALDRLVRTTEQIIDTDFATLENGMQKRGYMFGVKPATKAKEKKPEVPGQQTLFSKEAAPQRTQLGSDTMEMLEGIGRTVAAPEPGYADKVRQSWDNYRDNPQATREAAYGSFRRFADQVETWAFSSDAGLNNQIRREIMNSMVGQEQKIGMLLNTSLSQTAHSDAVSNLFLMEGNIRYDTELHKWVGVKDDNNIINLSKKLDEVAEKLGLTKPEVELMAHTAFEARRTQELNRFNEQIERQAAAMKEQARIDRAAGRPVAASALNEKANNLLKKKKITTNMTPEALQTGLRLYDMHPGLKEVTKIWNGIRQNALDRMVESGLYTAEEAEMLMSAADYVPFFREDQIEEGKGPKEFLRSLAVQADKRLKGSSKPVNDIFDNMVRWTQYAINRGVRNRSGLALATTAQQMGLADRVQDVRDGENVVTVWEDGKKVYFSMQDPMFVSAFRGLESVSIPTVKFFSKFADVLRQSVVLYPLFSIAQVPQDSFAAMFTSGLKPQHALTIPVRAVKEFIQTLRGKSKAHEELKNVGAVGVRDFTSAIIRADAEIAAGLKEEKGLWAGVKRRLGNLAMAADNAVRQATYEAALAQGLSRAEAIEKAFEIFNVRRRGNSQMLAMAGQVIPFFNAYLAAQHVAYRTLTGVGTSPTERKAALQTLAATTGSVMALSVLYAMMNGDDDDYLNKPTPTRDRLLMVPGTGGWVSIPLRADIFALPKVLAEHTYLLMTDNGYEDPAKFRASMASLLANSIFSPTPVPQAIKPLAEAIMNYDFFQQKPLVGTFQQRKELKQQFEDSTSEFAKVLGSTNMVSPIVADHFIRGMFGSFGGLFLYMTNPILADMAGKPRPTMSYQDALATIPNASGFVSKEYEVALRKDFYALKEVTDRVGATISDMKTRSPQELADYLSDEDVRARYALTPAVNQIAQQLTKIRTAVNTISQAPEERMSDDEKQRQIKQLREAELRLLKGVNLKALRERANI